MGITWHHGLQHSISLEGIQGSIMNSFRTEQELTEVILRSNKFYESLGYSNWVRWEEREFVGLFGIPDVVIGFGTNRINGSQPIVRIFAFEMKLRDWKRALVQAYKYAAFAHFPFVVMDHRYVGQAKSNISLFRRSNIGLISVEPNGDTVIHVHPRYRKPYSKSLNRALTERIVQDLFDR